MKIKIGTRGSVLARVQTQWVAKQLEASVPGLETECIVVKTLGDKILDIALDKIGDKGLFVKEIESALLDGTVDFAVHSLKDMPSELTPGLCFSDIPMREDPRDVLVLREGYKGFSDLPVGAVIGTGSKRRKYQLLSLRPDLKIVDIRGNIETRMNKIESEKLHGIVLAAAGLIRAGHKNRIAEYLDPEIFVPAAGQGALALQYREGDFQVKALLDRIVHRSSCDTVQAERSFLAATHGGCHAPVGAYATCDGITMTLTGLFGTDDGSVLVKRTATGPANEPEKLGVRLAEDILAEVRARKGKVYLVGAGPGDAGLMTLKGKAILERAEVLVYDRLGTPEMLHWVPEGCEKIYAGKQSSDHTLQQSEINRILIQKASEGKIVVRLKGGDPYVFGRGGEEALELAAAGIAFEEVPGITSAIAALAYAGIPATHRDVATSFHVFTAHMKGDEGRKDWDVIAKLDGTLIFLMGRAALPEITSQLIANGKAPETPGAIVQWGTTPKQKTVVGTLETLVSLAEAEGVGSPCIITVGPVVTLREQLSFFESRPLFGTTGVVTRSRTQSSQLTERLEAQGAQVIEIPAIRIVPQERDALKKAVVDIRSYTWLVFTSVNAVNIFFEVFMERYRDVRPLGHVKIAVIGEGTAQSLEKFGLVPDVLPEEYVAESLANALESLVLPGDRILMPRAKEARMVLKARLSQQCQVDEIPIYTTEQETMPDEIRASLIGAPPEFITFASSSTVRHFVRMAGAEVLEAMKNTKMISIGPVTSETMRELGLTVNKEASPHTIPGLVAAAVKILTEEKTCTP